MLQVVIIAALLLVVVWILILVLTPPPPPTPKSKALLGPAELEISVIIPAYNEAQRLPPTLKHTIAYLDSTYGAGNWEVIVVDDQSKDGTHKVVEEVQARRKKGSKQNTGEDIKIVRLEKNRGKGGAVREGMMHAVGKRILFQDADGASRLEDLAMLENGMQNNGIAIGSRAHLVGTDVTVKRSPIRNILMRGFHFLIYMLGPRGVADTQCGFKLFSRYAAQKIFPDLHCNGWIFDVEILLLAQWSEINIQEIGIAWEEIAGSKINIVVDAIRMARDLVLIRLNYATGMWRTTTD